MALTPWHLTGALTVLVAALVAAELRGWARARAALKPLASLVFVTAGALFLPLEHAPGRWLMAGLMLSLVGDVALIAKGKRAAFLAGLGAFLAAHLCYAAAFVARGQSSMHALGAGVVVVVAGALIARWLAPHVHGGMRGPVAAYVVTITAMVALAAGAWGAGARATLLAGAALFYLSDLCVARERFVARAPVNAAVGLPLYYAAQLLLVDGM